MESTIKLHPVTWVLVIAAGMDLTAALIDILKFAAMGSEYFGYEVAQFTAASFVSLVFNSLVDTGYFVASAATVEHLYRIWREVRFANRRPTADIAVELTPKRAFYAPPPSRCSNGFGG